MKCVPNLCCCVLQACEQLDDHLDTLAHRYLGTAFLRTRLSRHSRLPAVLGLPPAPGERQLKLEQRSFLDVQAEIPRHHGRLDHLLCSCARPGSLDLIRWKQVALVRVKSDAATLHGCLKPGLAAALGLAHVPGELNGEHQDGLRMDNVAATVKISWVS